MSWDLAGKKRSSRSASSPEVTGIWRKVVTVASDNVTAHALDIADAAVTGRLMISPAEPKLRPMPGDQDVCEIWNTAAGPEKGSTTTCGRRLMQKTESRPWLGLHLLRSYKGKAVGRRYQGKRDCGA